MAALSLMSSPSFLLSYGMASPIIFADGFSRFAHLLEESLESLCKEPSEIERDLVNMTLPIDYCLFGEGLKRIHRLFASAVNKIKENPSTSPSKLSGKQRENVLTNIQKIWSVYRDALNKSINDLASRVDFNQQRIKLMNAQIKHTRDRIAEISGFRSSSSWIPAALRFGASKRLASFPADWECCREHDVIAAEVECRRDSDSSCDVATLLRTSFVGNFSFPEMNSTCFRIATALQEIVNIKNQVEVLSQSFADKEKTPAQNLMVASHYYHLSQILVGTIKIKDLTREYEIRQRECEKTSGLAKEMALLAAIFGKLTLRREETIDLLNRLKADFKFLDSPRMEYEGFVASILGQAVIYKEMIEVTEHDSSFSQWSKISFERLKVQWTIALRYREEVLKALLKDIAKLEKQREEAISYGVVGQEQISSLFRLTKEDEDSDWVEVLPDSTVRASANRETRERKI